MTTTIATENSGTRAAAVTSTVVLLHTSSRRMLLPPKLESKYVRAVAPVPPPAVGSSAPESVDATLTRHTLMAGASASYGGVAFSAVTNAVQALLNAVCWAAVNPSASSTMVKARLRGAEPEIWVAPWTVPSEVVMAAYPCRRSRKLPSSTCSAAPRMGGVNRPGRAAAIRAGGIRTTATCAASA